MRKSSANLPSTSYINKLNRSDLKLILSKPPSLHQHMGTSDTATDIAADDTLCLSNFIEHNPNVETFGVFQKYPTGVFNPAFTAMFLFDYTAYKELSEYKICKFHSIKSGIILYGNEAFVFTPLFNNDLQSYLKILFRDKALPSSMTKTKVTKLIVEYIRGNYKRPILPCLWMIREYLSDIVGVSEVIFDGDHQSFSTLLHRIYMFMYMLHYNMPLQGKNTPGKRNLARSVYYSGRKGWYSYLSRKEQNVLNKESIFVSENSIPDDIINGIPIKEVGQHNVIASNDRINSCMIRDGSLDSITFQNEVKWHAHRYAKRRKSSGVDHIEEAPNIEALRQTVHSYMVG